jgi:RHS repeat-associated protein
MMTAIVFRPMVPRLVQRIFASVEAPSTIFVLFAMLWLTPLGHVGGAAAETITRAAPVTIEAADKSLRSRVWSKKQIVRPQLLAQGPAASGCASSSSLPIEIVTLADALKCDIDLIYEYVYNNIEYEPLFGSNKGALGTLLDQRGDDIDQANLFVALLNASGITQTSFIYGYITVTGTQVPASPCTATWIASAPGWLGVKNDEIAITQLLASGGIPYENGNVNQTDGTLECVDVAHVWVQVTINGTNYVFDPSFKQHVVSPGLSNLASIIGFSQSQFLADAGGTIGSDSSISNLNRANIRADLANYANNLVNYINSTNPAFTLNDVIGGKSIVPLAGSPIRQTSLPYLSNNQPSGFPQNWGNSIPDGYRACLAISMPGVTSQENCVTGTTQTIVLPADEVYGQRITVFSVPDQSHPGNYIPTLYVNGAPPSNGQNTGTSLSSGQWAIYASIIFPYVTQIFEDSGTLTVNVGGSYLIAAGFGRVGRGMAERHRQLLALASATNTNPASEPVLGEALATISYQFLAERAAQQAIGDAIGQVTTQYFHGVGIVAQTAIQASGHQGPYVDLPLNFQGLTKQTCWPNLECPFPGPTDGAFFTNSGTGSSFESAVLEQTQAPVSGMVAASTIRLVDLNAATGAKTFFADGTTSAGQTNYINNIRHQIATSYSSQDLQTIDVAVTGATPPPANPTPTQNQVLAPLNGDIAVGYWSGAGYTIIATTTDAIEIVQKITGGLEGGFTGTPVSTTQLTSNTNVTMPAPPNGGQVPAILSPPPGAGDQTVQEPVDAITGAEIYTREDLRIGSALFPYALPFGRAYISSSNLSDIGMGNGWAHTYSLAASANSDPYAGMGARSPIDSASAIVAIYVSQNLLSTSVQSAQYLTLAWIVDRWFTDQLTNNAAYITKPNTIEEYVVLPYFDGATAFSYNPPLGSSIRLISSGTGSGNPTAYRYETKHGVTLAFAPIPAGGLTLPIASWSWPNGMQIDFTYDAAGELTNVANNIGRSLTLSYSSNPNHVTAVFDGTRSVIYTYSGNDLASASDSLGNTTTYAYDTVGHLTQVFYPFRPNNAFLTNGYDPLGRVVQQANANGFTSNFYFAGSRTELVDAAGDRHVTYQTNRGKVLSDAFVLSSSFGDVFNDTVQQNGVVDVSTNQYDGLDRLTLTTLPEGGTTAFTYASAVNPWANNIASITRTAKLGSPLSPLTTSFSYDPIYNKPIGVTDPLGLLTTLSYDPATGNLLSITADAGGTGHLNATQQFSYDSRGRLQSAIDPRGVITTFFYDAFENLITQVADSGAGHLNATTRYGYDALGDIVTRTDPNGNTTKLAYDADRRPVSVIGPAPFNNGLGLVETTNAYDPDGHLLSLTRANGASSVATNISYTPTGQVQSVIDPKGNVISNGYDAGDRLVTVTDPLSRLTVYGYDGMSRRISVSNPAIQSAPLLQQSYTPDGLIASLTDANSNTTSFTPDGFDRLSTTTYPDSSTENYGYDADSNLLTRQTRKGDTITFTYDTLNRFSTKTAPSEPTVTYAHDLANNLIGVSDNSTTIATPTGSSVSYATSVAYDQLNRPLNVSWSPAPPQTTPSAASATFGYGYDATNRRINQSATDSSWWFYPSVASTTSYTINNLNQYSAVGSVAPTYDADGNLTYDGTFTYGYDAENRLISASGSGLSATYAYDAQGRRKSKTVNGTTTIFVTDADNRDVLEYNGSTGGVGNWYSYPLGPNAALNQMNVATATRATLIPDIQGSFVGALDATSGALNKTGYLSYGGSAAPSGSFGYTGQRIDPETNGLYYYRTRMYAPAWGRFMQADSIGYTAGSNLYAYVNNDPLNLTDPFGLTPDSPNQGALGSATTAGGTGGGGGSQAPPAAGGAGVGLSSQAAPGSTTNIAYQGVAPDAGMTPLFRAVNPAELADLGANAGVFKNPPGIEVKYFSETAEGATSYARQAYQAGGLLYQGPYTVVRTQIPSDLITPIMRQVVDRGVPSVVVPTELLPMLAPTQALPFTPLPRGP